MSLINPFDQAEDAQLVNPAGDGVTDYLTADGNGRQWPYNGDKANVSTSGSYGTGTLTLEVSGDGGATFFADDKPFSSTAGGNENILEGYPKGIICRFVLTGSTAPTISVYVNQSK